MADKWWEGFLPELLRELGIEWWFHRTSRATGGQAAPGATVAPQPQAPRRPLVPPALILKLSPEERRLQAPRFRGKLGDISAWSEGDQQKLADLPLEELREFFEIFYPTLKERLGKIKETVGRLDEKIEASPETKARLDRLTAWLRRIR